MRFEPVVWRRAMSIAWIVSIAALIGCGPASVESSSAIDMAFGDTELSVPQKFILPGLPNSIVPQNADLDDEQGISLRIPITDLGLIAEGSSERERGIIVLLTDISDDSLPPDALSAWNAEGLYQNRIVEFDYAVGLYRVYPNSGYPKIWQYFESSPDQTE